MKHWAWDQTQGGSDLEMGMCGGQAGRAQDSQVGSKDPCWL